MSLTGWTICVCYIFTVRTICLCYIFTVRTTCLCYIFTVRTIWLCYILTVRTTCLCYIFTARTVCLCYIFTARTICLCYILTVRTICLCYIFTTILSSLLYPDLPSFFFSEFSFSTACIYALSTLMDDRLCCSLILAKLARFLPVAFPLSITPGHLQLSSTFHLQSSRLDLSLYQWLLKLLFCGLFGSRFTFLKLF